MNDLKFQINKNKFYSALQIASRASCPTSPVPALAGVKIEANEKGLTLTGSDASISTQVYLSNEKDENLDLVIDSMGVIVMEARYLLDIVRKMDSNIMTIQIIDGTLIQFTGNKANYKMNGYQPENYPTIDFAQPSEGFEIESNLFKDLIDQTIFAVSTKPQRPVLTGINFNADGEKIIATATDSFRLARKTLNLQTEPFNVTVPSKVLNEAKNIYLEEPTIHISLDDRKIQFKNDSVLIQSTLLEGGYPKVDRLIPTQFSEVLVMDKDQFVRAIDRALFIKTDNITNIRMEINSVDDIHISTSNQEIGSFNETLSAVSFEGNPFNISFAGLYFNEAAKSFKSSNIRIQFTGQFTPLIIQEDNGDDSLLQLILPVRTSK